MEDRRPQYLNKLKQALREITKECEAVTRLMHAKEEDSSLLKGGFHQLLQTVSDFVQACVKLVSQHLQQLRQTSEAKIKLLRVQEQLAKLHHKWDHNLETTTKAEMDQMLQQRAEAMHQLEQTKEGLLFADQVIITCDAERIWDTLREATRIQIAGLDSMFELQLPRSPFDTEVTFEVPQHEFLIQPIERTPYFMVYNLKKEAASVEELPGGAMFPDQFGLTQIKTHALVAGGRGQFKAVRQVLSLSKDGQVVQQKAKMGLARCCFPLAALKQRFVFATGGFNNDWLKECERFDFKSNTWKNLPPLLRKRFFHASASFRDQYVYVYCGSAGFGHFLSSIERYTLSQAKWDIVHIYNPSPFWKRRSQIHALQMPDSNIYVFGEWHSNHASFRLTHGARHSLMISGVQWTKTAPGTGCQFGACLWEDKPFCVERNKAGLGVSYFNLEEGKWKQWEGTIPGNIDKVIAAVERRDAKEPTESESSVGSPVASPKNAKYGRKF